jgi:hypothetical protein
MPKNDIKSVIAQAGEHKTSPFTAIIPVPEWLNPPHKIKISSKSHHLEVIVAERSCAHNLQQLSIESCIQATRLTAMGPDPEIIVVPAEFTTFTDTVPVVIPRNEKPLKPGVKA